MAGAIMQFPNKSCSTLSVEFSTKNAWAQYARRRWPTNTLNYIGREWNLSTGEARGVLYAQISQATIEKITDHKNGGRHLALTILAIRFGESVEDFIAAVIQQQRQEIDRERRRLDAADERARGAYARLRGGDAGDRPSVRLVPAQDGRAGRKGGAQSGKLGDREV